MGIQRMLMQRQQTPDPLFVPFKIAAKVDAVQELPWTQYHVLSSYPSLGARRLGGPQYATWGVCLISNGHTDSKFARYLGYDPEAVAKSKPKPTSAKPNVLQYVTVLIANAIYSHRRARIQHQPPRKRKERARSEPNEINDDVFIVT